jgi:aminopeptidase N
MKRSLLIGLFASLSAFNLLNAKDGYPLIKGIDILHYTFSLNLEDTTDRINVTSELTILMTLKTRTLGLDLTGLNDKGTGMTVSDVTISGLKLPFSHVSNRINITLPDTLSVPGQFKIRIHYSGIPADGLIISRNKYGDRTFFGDNWPDRARNWLACLDHPSDKATVEFIVKAPAHYKVIGVGYLAAEYPFEPLNPDGKYRVTHWKEGVAVPTKVMVIGLADFAWETAGFSKGVPVQTWVYSEDRENGFSDYLPGADILTFFQDLIGPYSYEKLANVQSKTIYGGMENSSCIFYYENSVSGKNKMHSLLAHEIAHQWFGDAVTEKDWHHVWLSEGFATYLEAVYADSLIPDRSLVKSMAGMREQVIRSFKRDPKPVIDTTITNYMELLSTNSYQKGAWVLHMLRDELGDEVFWKGIRQYYQEYQNKNALTSDFCRVMEEVSGRSLVRFFHQWLEVAGQPDISWSWAYDSKNRTVTIDLTQNGTGEPFAFRLPVRISNETGSAVMSTAPPVTERQTRISFPVDFKPSSVVLDPDVNLLFTQSLVVK